MQPRITISMACYGRPMRTSMAVASIQNQTEQNWEAFITADGPEGYLPINQDPRFHFRRTEHYGGHGYHQHNLAIDKATGKYMIFMGNDDILSPDHFCNYLDAIEGTDLDFVWVQKVYIGTKLKKWGMREGRIGHAALIIRTEFLKKMPRHIPGYGHDWLLIQNMIGAGAKFERSKNPATYYCDPLGWKKSNIDE